MPFDWNAGETTERKAGFDWNAGTPVAPPRPSFWEGLKGAGSAVADVATSHAIKSLGGPTLSELYDKASPPIEGKGWLPRTAEGARRVGRIPAELGDFMLTPLGAATAATGGAPAAVRAGVGAGFSTDIGYNQVPEAWREFKKDPGIPAAVDLGKAAAFTALPFLHPAVAALKGKPKPLTVAPDVPPPPGPIDAGPVPKGVLPRARESAEVFMGPQPVKSASESARVLEQVGREEDAIARDRAAGRVPPPVPEPPAPIQPIPTDRLVAEQSAAEMEARAIERAREAGPLPAPAPLYQETPGRPVIEPSGRMQPPNRPIPIADVVAATEGAPPPLEAPGPVAPVVPPPVAPKPKGRVKKAAPAPLETPPPLAPPPVVEPPRVAPVPAAAKAEAIPAQTPVKLLVPFGNPVGDYIPLGEDASGVRYRFTNKKGHVSENVMPRAAWDGLAAKGEAVVAGPEPPGLIVAHPEMPPAKGEPLAPAEPVPPAPTVAPNATVEAAPPALGSEPVAPGGVAAAGVPDEGGGAKRVIAPAQGGSGLPLSSGERPPSQRGAVTFGEKVPVSPNYEESKVKIPGQFRISPQAQGEFAKNLAEWERETPERRAISFSEVEAQAATYPEEILRKLEPPKTGETLNPAVRVAASRMVSRFMDEVAARRKALTDNALKIDQASVMAEEAEINRIEQDARRTSDVLIRARSQDGRNLRYYYDMAKGDLDPTVWLAQAKKAVGLPANVPIPDKVYQTVTEAVTEARQAVAKAKASGNANVDTVPAVVAAKAKLAKTMAKLEESGWWETLTALRKAGLLTGLKTHARNIFGNSAFQVMEEAAKFPAAFIDIGLSWKTGERTVTGISLRAVQSASRKASTDGVKQAYEILKNGATPEQLLKGEVYREVNFQGLGKASKLINAYANSVFRTLAAEDQVFRSYGVERSIQAQAKVLAMNEARTKQIAQADVLKRTRYLTQNPTEAMALQAIEDAEFATFNNKNWLATGVSSLKTGIRTSAASLEGKRHHLGATAGANALLFGIDWVLPFVRTPANIGARMFDYTLGAPLKTVFHATTAMARGLTPERQHAISTAIGRGSIGWGLMLLGYYKASQGEATGVGKKDPNQRNVSEAVGEQPGAILLGGKWRKISPLSPGGNIIAMGASLYERGSSPKTGGFTADVGQVGAQTLLDQPMLQGPSEFMDVMKDPERRGQKFISSAAGSVVPTAVSDIATAVEPTRREYPTGPIEGVASRLPGVRTTLPEKYDVLGRPLEASRMSAIDPFLSKTAKQETSPVDRELAKHNIGIGKPSKLTDEDADEYRLRMAIRGRYILESLNGLVADREYPAATDAEKKAALKIAVREGTMNFAREWREFASENAFRNAAKPQRIERLQSIIATPQ